MKYLFIILLAIPATSRSQTLEGTWMGKIQGVLPIVFHFSKQPTMDSPQQGAFGLAIQSVTLNGDSLQCTINAPKASYVAVRVNDTTFKGYWIQGTARIPLDIHPQPATATVAIVTHPQTPHPPYPYHSDSVEYDNAAKTVHLGATLTYPETGGPFPVAVLITGSGIQDRDETLLGHKPFAVIADYLTKRGYAILRVDDRTAGLSTGDVQKATTADFANDVETSLAYLKTRKEIDTTRMGLIGHSEGAMIAPMVAARDPWIAFIILLAGPAEGGRATMLYQVARPAEMAGASKAEVQYSRALEGILLDEVVKAKDQNELITTVDSSYRNRILPLADSLRVPADKIESPEQLQTTLKQQGRILLSPWYRFFIAYDPAPDFARLRCPILALGGDKDFQVHNAKDFEVMQQIVNPAEKAKLETHLLPGLNHLFQHCKTCEFSEYGQLSETFSPEALQIMGDWMDKHVRSL